MKRYLWLAVFGCACLSLAAVWLGGLNQDEGWYLYAANLVREGRQVYRDFAYTQAPLMPKIYAAFTWVWARWGLLGARVFTLALGLIGVSFASLTARNLVLSASCLVPGESGEKGERVRAGNMAAVMVALLLGCNLYHLYYLAIPKTYALASLFVMAGFLVLATRDKPIFAAIAGFLLAQAAGVRISLGAILPVVGVMMLVAVARGRATLPMVIGFGVGGVLGLFTAYGFVLFDAGAMKGFLAAQAYHAARGGFDLTWVVGSVSRLVRWYLPVFVVLGLGVSKKVEKAGGGGQWNGLAFLFSFLAVFVVQMLAPFPYEDYQVPIMGLLAVFAAVNFVIRDSWLVARGSCFVAGDSCLVSRASCLVPGAEDALSTKHQALSTKHQARCTRHEARSTKLLLVLGLTFASSFGSPLLEKWMTNGQDRFWSLKKEKCELAQLREAARDIEAIDPGGKTLFTQDLYLAIETNRKVPEGLEMGPFAVLDDAGWRRLIGEAPATCNVAAISGYTFAIEPPKCNERPLEQQLEYFGLLKRNYDAVERVTNFGQNATTLLLLKRKEVPCASCLVPGAEDAPSTKHQAPSTNTR